MSTPKKTVTRFTEHEKMAEFLASLNRAELSAYINQTDDAKETQFYNWVEKTEVAADFKDLVPMHIRMNTEEWNWFQARLAEEDARDLPNLRAMMAAPPKAFKDLD